MTPDHVISGVEQTGFEGGSGEIQIPEANSLRGMAVDAKGRIWIADLGGNQLFRVEPTGKDLKVLALHTPCALAFDGNRGYVTRSQEREITVIDDEMNILGNLTVPWTDLELSTLGNQHLGSLAGIAADPGKGFYVANELGQTADQRSTYGRVGDSSDVVKGKLYSDTFGDDNEPILHGVLLDSDERTSAPVSEAAAAPADSKSSEIPVPSAELPPSSTP